MIGKKSTLRLAMILVAGLVLVSVPATHVFADTGQIDDVSRSGENGEPGGNQADPDQWDIDSWKRGTIEETQPEVKLPQISERSVFSRVFNWISALLKDLQLQQHVVSQDR